MEGIMLCPICDSDKTRECYSLYDDRYGFPGKFCYRVCGDCIHAWCIDPPSGEDAVSLYSSYYPRSDIDPACHKPHCEVYGFRSWLNGSRKSAYSYVPHGVRVLDIGCGSCESIGYHLSRGCIASGVESDMNVSKVAETYGYNVKIGTFSPDDYGKDSFDYITLDQVLEHMVDPFQCLADIYRVLRHNGKVIISTPNIAGWGAGFFKGKWIHWHPPYHIHLFSAGSLAILARKTGYNLKSIRTQTSSDWLHFQWCHIVTYPVEAKASEFWSKRSPTTNTAQVLLRMCCFVHYLKINHIVTRFFDSIDKGDNIVAILEKR